MGFLTSGARKVAQTHGGPPVVACARLPGRSHQDQLVVLEGALRHHVVRTLPHVQGVEGCWCGMRAVHVLHCQHDRGFQETDLPDFVRLWIHRRSQRKPLRGIPLCDLSIRQAHGSGL